MWNADRRDGSIGEAQPAPAGRDRGTLHTGDRGTLHMTDRGHLHMTDRGTLHTADHGTLYTADRGTLHTADGGTLHTADRDVKIWCVYTGVNYVYFADSGSQQSFSCRSYQNRNTADSFPV